MLVYCTIYIMYDINSSVLSNTRTFYLGQLLSILFPEYNIHHYSQKGSFIFHRNCAVLPYCTEITMTMHCNVAWMINSFQLEMPQSCCDLWQKVMDKWTYWHHCICGVVWMDEHNLQFVFSESLNIYRTNVTFHILQHICTYEDKILNTVYKYQVKYCIYLDHFTQEDIKLLYGQTTNCPIINNYPLG